jgi:hypothetical protein
VETGKNIRCGRNFLGNSRACWRSMERKYLCGEKEVYIHTKLVVPRKKAAACRCRDVTRPRQSHVSPVRSNITKSSPPPHIIEDVSPFEVSVFPLCCVCALDCCTPARKTRGNHGGRVSRFRLAQQTLQHTTMRLPQSFEQPMCVMLKEVWVTSGLIYVSCSGRLAQRTEEHSMVSTGF